jgi:HK97 family phage major capsid protein
MTRSLRRSARSRARSRASQAPLPDFLSAAPGEPASARQDIYEREGKSFFNDIVLARKGIPAARERLLDGYDYAEGKALMGYRLDGEGKAMSEGTANQGGYLVQPSVERRIVLARESDNVLRASARRSTSTRTPFSSTRSR